MKPLFIPLTTYWYAEFKAGRKTIELRKYGKRWNEKTCLVGRAVILSRGYGKQDRLERVIGDVTIAAKAQALPAELCQQFMSVFSDPGSAVIAICLTNRGKA